MAAPLNLTADEATAVFNLLDAYLRTEASGDELAHLRAARRKLNHLWRFEDDASIGAGDAREDHLDLDQP